MAAFEAVPCRSEAQAQATPGTWARADEGGAVPSPQTPSASSLHCERADSLIALLARHAGKSEWPSNRKEAKACLVALRGSRHALASDTGLVDRDNSTPLPAGAAVVLVGVEVDTRSETAGAPTRATHPAAACAPAGAARSITLGDPRRNALARGAGCSALGAAHNPASAAVQVVRLEPR
jgi:hypothetical protein